MVSYTFRREDNCNLQSCFISINDIILKVQSQVGDEFEVDASCDSAFMVPDMDCVGEAIRKAYWWIDLSQ